MRHCSNSSQTCQIFARRLSTWATEPRITLSKCCYCSWQHFQWSSRAGSCLEQANWPPHKFLQQMTDNSRFPKMRVHQVFGIHLLRRKAAQTEDKRPFIIYVGTGAWGRLAKVGLVPFSWARTGWGSRNIFWILKGLYTRFAGHADFVFTKGDFPVFLKLFEILANPPSHQRWTVLSFMFSVVLL